MTLLITIRSTLEQPLNIKNILYSLRNRLEKLTKSSHFYLFLQLVNINYIFSDNVRILSIYFIKSVRCNKFNLSFSTITWTTWPIYFIGYYIRTKWQSNSLNEINRQNIITLSNKTVINLFFKKFNISFRSCT
jgi:hypothetical protein